MYLDGTLVHELAQFVPWVSNDQNRRMINQVCLWWGQDDRLWAEATNGHILLRQPVNGVADPPPWEPILVDPRTLKNNHSQGMTILPVVAEGWPNSTDLLQGVLKKEPILQITLTPEVRRFFEAVVHLQKKLKGAEKYAIWVMDEGWRWGYEGVNVTFDAFQEGLPPTAEVGFNPEYLLAVLDLPSLRYAVTEPVLLLGADPLEAFWFTIDRGLGVIMPMRV